MDLNKKVRQATDNKNCDYIIYYVKGVCGEKLQEEKLLQKFGNPVDVIYIQFK